MMAQWWVQVRAVMRLEIRKTFLSKRGLWVYAIALAPAVLFAWHAFSVSAEQERRRALADAHPLSTQALESVQRGMTRQQVEDMLGEPYSSMRAPRGLRSRSWYTDGRTEYVVNFAGDVVVGINRLEIETPAGNQRIFAAVFQFFYLRLAVFFGCVGVFMNLFRGELLEKSLHFYLLAPLRREVLVAGKYIAGLIATIAIFTTSTALQFWASIWTLDASARAQYLASNGWNHLAAYLGVTVLACVGYGSIFLVTGMLFRNPIIPAAGVLLWEGANLFLPAALKKVSVIFYLQSLCPVVAPPERGLPPLLALLLSSAEPATATAAIAGLLILTAAVLTLAMWRARRLEINYSAD
jgi:ABC-type transport system involved in multi-copper enzyme maturation permease subunit